MFKNLSKMAGDAVKQAKAAIDKAQGKEEPKEEEAPQEEEKAAEAKQEEPAYTGPPRLTEEQAAEAAQGLRAAMKGIGTSEDKVIEILAPLNYVQAQQVVEAYAAAFEDRDLVKDLKSELGGKLETVMVGLVTSPGDFLADTLRAAFKGIGSNEELAAEAICTATDEELRAAAKAYRLRHERILVDDVASELGGKFEQLLLTVLRAALSEEGRTAPDNADEQVEEDVLRLYKAGEDKIGTNTGVFIEILGGNSREYVGRVADAYAKKYGKSLVKVIKSELGDELEVAFLALVRPQHETYADLLHKAMKGAGTDSDTMIRVLVGQRHRMAEMNEYFLNKHEKNIARWVKAEVGGDLEDALVLIVESRT